MSAAPKVSVVVPVFDPGADIDECIASLLGQSLPEADYEAIFVDDGSTDGTGERLDALAVEHAHVRVEHIPNSGWPGRPRNVGLEMARGDFVFFADNDDWLEPDALERLYDTAVRDGADVVVGKVVGHGRRIPRPLFARNRHAVELGSPDLLGLLTPHKLFRRDFLAEHGIRFPEGRRRLEDHPFVMGAYLAGARISVLADRPVYHWARRDSTTASSRRFDPQAYYGNVREVLDLVVARTEPGPRRERLLAHWYRGKLLERVGGGGFAGRDPEYRRALYEAVREIALERYGDEVHDRLPFNLRVRSKLLRAGAFEALLALAEWESGLEAKVRLEDVRGPGSFLVVRVRVRLPVEFDRDGDRLRWVAPGAVAEALTHDDLIATRAVRRSAVDAYLWADDVEWPLDAGSDVRIGDRERVRPTIAASIPIAPSTAAAGAPLPAGDWALRVSAALAGFRAGRTVRVEGEPLLLTCDPPTRISLREPAGAAAAPA